MEKLIIIGASYLQLPLIQKANELGYETHVFAWEKGSVGKEIACRFYPISILEKEKILKAAKKIKPVGVISIASDLAIKTVNYIASELGLIGNSMKCTEITTNKFIMRETLQKSGLPCPAFDLCSGNDLPDVSNMNFPLVIKPTDRSGSRGVEKIEHPEQIGHAIDRAWKESHIGEAMIEEFVEGKEISVEMISWKGKHHYLCCTDKITSGPPYFVELEHHEPASLTLGMEEKIVELTKKALRALKIEYGASHTEIIITPDNKFFIVEVGARMGGDHIGAKLVYFSTGYDLIKAAIDVATGNFSPVHKSHSAYSGIYYLISNPGIIKDLKWNYPLADNIVDHQFIYNKGDTIRNLSNSTDRLGYVIYRSTNNRIKVNSSSTFTIEFKDQ